MMDELIAFLRARLADDEYFAEVATPGRPARTGTSREWIAVGTWFPDNDNVSDLSEMIAGYVETYSGQDVVEETINGPDAWHIARHDPARVLREVKTKRRIVELHSVEVSRRHGNVCEHDLEDAPCLTLRALASVYSDHEDYREEWRVEEAG